MKTCTQVASWRLLSQDLQPFCSALLKGAYTHTFNPLTCVVFSSTRSQFYLLFKCLKHIYKHIYKKCKVTAASAWHQVGSMWACTGGGTWLDCHFSSPAVTTKVIGCSWKGAEYGLSLYPLIQNDLRGPSLQHRRSLAMSKMSRTKFGAE